MRIDDVSPSDNTALSLGAADQSVSGVSFTGLASMYQTSDSSIVLDGDVVALAVLSIFYIKNGLRKALSHGRHLTHLLAGLSVSEWSNVGQTHLPQSRQTTWMSMLYTSLAAPATERAPGSRRGPRWLCLLCSATPAVLSYAWLCYASLCSAALGSAPVT